MDQDVLYKPSKSTIMGTLVESSVLNIKTALTVEVVLGAVVVGVVVVVEVVVSEVVVGDVVESPRYPVSYTCRRHELPQN